MRRQFVTQAAERAIVRGRAALAQLGHLAHQTVDLELLLNDNLIQLVQHVFGETGLDLEVGQAAVCAVDVFHGPIGIESAQLRAESPRGRPSGVLKCP